MDKFPNKLAYTLPWPKSIVLVNIPLQLNIENLSDLSTAYKKS